MKPGAPTKVKPKRNILLGLALTLATQPAVAQLPETGNLNYNSHSYNYRGVGVGPYVGSIPGHPSIDLYCVDFLNHAPTSPTEYWFTSFSDIQTDVDANGGALLESRTRWGYDGGSPLGDGANWENYKKAAYLTTFFDSRQNAREVGELHSAIWHLYNPTNPSWATSTTDAEWLALAEQNYQAYFADNAQYWYIASDISTNTGSRGSYNQAGGGGQE